MLLCVFVTALQWQLCCVVFQAGNKTPTTLFMCALTAELCSEKAHSLLLYIFIFLR